jgi:hypothetical protein
MKQAGETLSAGTVFADANNVQMSIVGQVLSANPPLLYPETGNVDFIAYYPHVAPLASGFTIPVSLSQEILYSSNAKNKAPSDAAVELQFKYSLAKIRVTVIPAEGNEASYSVSDFANVTLTIEGMNTTGNLKLVDGSFDNLGTVADITPTRTDDKSQKKAVFETLVLPTDVADGIVFKFNVNGRTFSDEPGFTYKTGTLHEIEYAFNFSAPKVAMMKSSEMKRSK